MGDALLVTFSPRLPEFRILMTVSDLPSLLRRRQEMGRHRGSRLNVLRDHWSVCFPFAFP